MTTLSGPKRCSKIEDAPQQWEAVSTSTIWEGAVVGSYPIGTANAGYIDNIEASLALQVRGVARRNVASAAVAPFNQTEVDEIIIPMVFAAIDTTMRGAVVYGVDSATASMSPLAGPPIGMLMEIKSATKGMVGVGPAYLSRALASGAGGSPGSTPLYDAVITTIAAYTGTTTGVLTASATGAIGAQDTGVTILAGMRVFLPLVTGGAGGATVAADSGPYIATSPGAVGVKFVLTRPPEYQHGGIIPEDVTYRIKPEGTSWGGNEFRSFPTTGAKVIDTDDPHFWPRTFAAVLAVGVANTTFWLKDVNKVAATNLISAHAFWLSTLTAGAGSGAITITGTAADTYATMAINW